MNKNLLRALPKIYFGKDLFYVETRLWEFRQHNDPGNRISFDDLFELSDESFLLAYDHNIKNLFLGDLPLPDHVSLFRIPKLELLDPVGLSRKHNFMAGDETLEDAYIEKFTKWFSVSDKKVIEAYGIPETIQLKRRLPHFGEYDSQLMKAKFKKSR